MKTFALRRNVVIGLMILFVGAFVVQGVAHGDTIYVDDDNTSGPWDGTLEHPYQHIQDGIDNASAGDTVFVFNGIYEENVEIYTTISLMGEDKDSTIIDAGGYGDVVLVSADSVNISGFTIQNGGDNWPDAGIDIRSAAFNTISGNIISNRKGVNLDQSSYNTISGNTINGGFFNGMVLLISSNNNILDNSITNGMYIFLSSDDNIISGNNITNSNRGIWLAEWSCNNTISGNTLTNNTCGIFLSDSSDNNTISGDTITNNDAGISVSGSSNSNMTDNYIADNTQYGIVVSESSNNDTISGNTITNNGLGGIYLTDSYNITILDNYFVSCGIIVEFGSLSYWDSLTIENNSVNGKALRYYKNTSDVVVPANTGQLILANCTNFTIENLNLSNTSRGIHLAFSSYNDISGDTIANNSNFGLLLYESSHDTISENEITENGYSGIRVKSYSNDNVISGNTITNTTICGIDVDGSSGISIFDNDITDNEYGIKLHSSADNTIFENTMYDNDYGIRLFYTSNSMIYHNNFIDNALNALASNCVNNIWDDDYPSGGNYWSDYTGLDQDGDGIGDTPYDVPGSDNQDRYPLMYPWGDSTVFVDDDADSGWYDATHVRTIQEGIKNVAHGGVVYVYKGIYSEHVIVDKKLILVGQGRDSVIVDGGGGGDVVYVSADSVHIRGFTFQNSGSGAGIVILSDYSTVRLNNVANNEYGLYLTGSSINNAILDNGIIGNEYGLYLTDLSINNTIFDNVITDNGYGTYIIFSSNSNFFYHNNFINNTQNAYDECTNTWDDGCPSGGNYWDDYTGIDENQNGLGDTPYDIPGGSNQDQNPLMNPWDGTPVGPLCGDANGNGIVDVGDIIYLLNYLYFDGPEPWPARCVGDCNVDGSTDSGDIVYLLGYLFGGASGPGGYCCCTLK